MGNKSLSITTYSHLHKILRCTHSCTCILLLLYHSWCCCSRDTRIVPGTLIHTATWHRLQFNNSTLSGLVSQHILGGMDLSNSMFWLTLIACFDDVDSMDSKRWQHALMKFTAWLFTWTACFDDVDKMLWWRWQIDLMTLWHWKHALIKLTACFYYADSMLWQVAALASQHILGGIMLWSRWQHASIRSIACFDRPECFRLFIWPSLYKWHYM